MTKEDRIRCRLVGTLFSEIRSRMGEAVRKGPTMEPLLARFEYRTTFVYVCEMTGVDPAAAEASVWLHRTYNRNWQRAMNAVYTELQNWRTESLQGWVDNPTAATRYFLAYARKLLATQEELTWAYWRTGK